MQQALALGYLYVSTAEVMGKAFSISCLLNVERPTTLTRWKTTWNHPQHKWCWLLNYPLVIKPKSWFATARVKAEHSIKTQEIGPGVETWDEEVAAFGANH